MSDEVHKSVKLYLSEIDQAEKARKPWVERAKKIVKRYKDERPTENDGRKVNILWSNVETLKPALYSRTPKPYVERKHKDKDPRARAASEILERDLHYSLTAYDFDYTIQSCRNDWLLPGLGQAWIEYDVSFAQDGVTKTNENVWCKYVNWMDFGHNTARTWDEVRIGWRKMYVDREELMRVFGQDEGARIPLDFTPESIKDNHKNDSENDEFKRACIYEIWDKKHRVRVYLSKSKKDGPIRVDPDPLGLRNFFPFPRPLLATVTTDDLIPTPDFALYQDQALELDNVVARRSSLIEALRAVGIYDASLQGLQEVLNRMGDNFLVPVKNWAAIVQAGGIEGAISWIPLEQIAKVLGALTQEAQNLKQEIYETTGLSDIIRGASDPRETATAQQIKGQFSTLRIAERQAEIQRFCRDIIAIKGEIMAEKFDPKTLAMMAGIDVNDPQKQQLVMSAVQLLRDDKLRSYKIDIETDSTIAVDDQIEKQKRTEYLEAVGTFMQNGLQFAANLPATLPFIVEAILFASRGFKSGRQLEATLESVLEQVQVQAQQQIQAQQQAAQQPPPPDPKMIEAETKAQLAQQELALKEGIAIRELGLKEQVAFREAQLAQFEQERKVYETEAQLALQAAKLQPGASDAATVAASTPTVTAPTNPLPIINVNIGKGKKPKRTRAAIVRDPETGDMIGAELEEIEEEPGIDVPVEGLGV